LITRIWLVLLGAVVMAAGLFFLAGGGYLLWLGGSWYFLTAGIVLIVAGLQIFGGRASGAALFGLVFLATGIWAIWEVGFQFWPLVSRLFAMAVGSLVIAASVPLLTRDAIQRRTGYGAAIVLAIGIVATTVSAFSPKNMIAPNEAAVPAAPAATSAPATDWAAWGANNAGTRFSALGDITPENIGQLRVAWTAHTGETPQSTGSGAEDQNTPIQIGDSLFVCTAYGTVLSLDADTGAEKWRYVSGGTVPSWQRCRSVAYYDATTAARVTPLPDGADATVSPRRIFVPTVDARLIALDVDTGRPAANFGDNGIVDLKVGMGEVKPGYYQQTSTPLVAGNLVILGGRVADNNETGEPPGVVRAFDAVTGQLVWAWDPGNRPSPASRSRPKAIPAARRMSGRPCPMTPSSASSTCRPATRRRTSGRASAPSSTTNTPRPSSR
jgi:quinate dehydrogenase (quinone)